MSVCVLSQTGEVDLHRCKDVSIPVSVALTPHQCSGRMAQEIMAEWVQSNPGWWITRWKCLGEDTGEQSI